MVIENICNLKNAVIKQAIEDWCWWELYGVPIAPGTRQNSLLQRKKDADKAWKFLNNEYGNLWLFTELTPDAITKIARQKLEMLRNSAENQSVGKDK